MEFSLAWWIFTKPPNLIPPITQHLYMKQWLIFRIKICQTLRIGKLPIQTAANFTSLCF